MCTHYYPTPSFLHPPRPHSELLCSKNLPKEPWSVFPSQCAPCFLSCGCHRVALPALRMWREGPPEAAMLLSLPHQTLPLSPWKPVQRQRDRAEATANLWPLWLSPVQRRTLKPVMGWPRLCPETHDTASAPQWPLCVSCSQASFASAAQPSAPNCMRLNLQSHLMIQEDHFIAFSTVLN